MNGEQKILKHMIGNKAYQLLYTYIQYILPYIARLNKVEYMLP